MTLDSKLKATLEGISTGTLTTILLKKGLRNVWIRSAGPWNTGGRRIDPSHAKLIWQPGRALP